MEIKPQVRFLKEIKSLLFDKNWAKTAANSKLYYIYRAVKKKGELRYDITLIPSKMLGKEFVKTKGNRNSDNYPELYTVLKGEAIFLMQKSEGKTVKEAFFSRLKKGDWIVIPDNYYVVAINPLKKDLKLANWVSEKNKNTYETIEKMKGACYFFTENGWIKNENYKSVPKLKFKKPLKKKPKDLSFLR